MKNRIFTFNNFFVHCWYNSFASIVCENETYLNWIYKNSFNWVYEEKPKKNLFNWNDSKFYCIRTDNIFEELDKVLEIQSPKLDGDVSKLLESNLIEGKYIFVLCDRFYQSGHFEYNKIHNYHYSLVYGFDSEKRIYHILSDCQVQDQIEKWDISMDSFMQSKIMADNVQLGVKEFEQNIYIIRKKDNLSQCNYELNVKDIIKNCSDILCKKNENDNVFYGVEAISKLADNVIEIIEREINKERLIKKLASSFAIAANNEIRNKLLCKVLFNNNVMKEKDYEQLIIKFQKLKEKWDTLYLLVIKLVTLSDMSIANKIKKRLLEMCDLELDANACFREILENSCKEEM